MEWSFNPIGGPWIAAAVFAALLILPWVVAPRDAALTPRRRGVLVVLRTLATLLLLAAWLRPTIVRVSVESLRPALVVMIDSSLSMSVEDALDGASRWEATRRMLAASEGALTTLRENRDLRVYRFDSESSPVGVSEGGRVELPASPEGEATALGASLAETLDQEAGSLLDGVVLISDGAQRAAPPRDLAPLGAVQRMTAEGAPLYAITVGERASGSQADVGLEDLIVSDVAFAGAPLEATASLRVAGYPNRDVRVRMLWEDEDGKMRPVDAAVVTVLPGVNAFPVRLRYTPPAAGEWKLTLEAETLEGETITSNNLTSTFVTVREGGVRVLYLAGATRPGGAPGLEQRFIRASLATSPDLVVRRRVFDYRQPRRDLTEALRSEPPDVVILDNLDGEALDRSSWLAVADLVERGGGLAMLGGRQSFGAGGHADTPLAEVLPLTLSRLDRQALDQPPRGDAHLPGPIRIVPAERSGVAHPILRLADENASAWAKLTPLDGANRLDATRLKPNAVVIAYSDDPAAPAPLMVIAQPGLGRSLVFAGDTTWRWPLAGQGEAHRRFWRQVVLWLAKKEDDRSSPVYLELASRRVAPGARLDLVAGVRLRDEQQTGTDGIRFEAAVTMPDGSTRPLPLPGGVGRSAGVFTQTRLAGDYRVGVRALRGDQELGRADSRFLVPERNPELQRPGAEPDTMSRLAMATESAGGRSLALEELPDLFAQISERPVPERQEITSRVTLWDKWPVMIALVGLMSTEWFLRRQWGLP